jgi:O-antigen/teichoic acid export membrane protein
MKEDLKGCLTVLTFFLVFMFIGDLLVFIIEKAGNVIVWLIRAAIFIPLTLFIIMCIRGMKNKEEEDD